MNLLLRTDASVAIGTGHVMRCIALAQAWQDADGTVVFAMVETTPAVSDRLLHENAELVTVDVEVGSEEDAQRVGQLAHDFRADWVVVDGYRFDAAYQRALKSAGVKILFLDDYGHASHYSADVILNQNVSTKAELYSEREPGTRLLLGTRYCLLRREFSSWRDWKREISAKARRVLVMMGGSDPENLTTCMIEALALTRIDRLEAMVVVGGSNPHFEEVKKAAMDSGLKISVRKDVSDLPEIMARADVAISAAGSTCWELCMLGLPALLIDVADNQTTLAKELSLRGCAIHVGDRNVSAVRISEELQRLSGDQSRRQTLSQHSRELVDGKGARRVVSALRGADGLTLRRAQPGDARLLWEWANDPEVRAASFSPDPIPWETHVAWFDEKINSEEKPSQRKSLVLIAEDEEKVPIGQIRFDPRRDGGWEVDVSVVKAMRGMGLSSELIKLGVREVRIAERRASVHAFVKPENTPSLRAFERAGFKQSGTSQVLGHAAIHFVCED